MKHRTSRHRPASPPHGTEETRQRISREAARIMAEEGVRDFHVAKRKAAERLNFPEARQLPSNQEIERALTEHLQLFHAKDLPQTLQHLRRLAIEAMRMLERFDPPAPEILSHALFALAMENQPADRVIDAMVQNLASQQLSDGSWGAGGILRPPTNDGPFSMAAMAIRVLREYAPPGRQAAMRGSMSSANVTVTVFAAVSIFVALSFAVCPLPVLSMRSCGRPEEKVAVHRCSAR